MFRRFLNKSAMLAMRLRTIAFACALLAPSVALAAPPEPLVMGPLYVEPAPEGGGSAATPATAPAPGCAVQIAEISDPRRAPEVLGMIVTFRSIVAPQDRQAWLRSVFEVGLSARGFTPTFATPAAEGATSAPGARISVRAIWLSTLATNKSASVVLTMSNGPEGGTRIYRGDLTSVNWAGTTSEFNTILNRAFALALDSMAADLRAQCGAVTTASAS